MWAGRYTAVLPGQQRRHCTLLDLVTQGEPSLPGENSFRGNRVVEKLNGSARGGEKRVNFHYTTPPGSPRGQKLNNS